MSGTHPNDYDDFALCNECGGLCCMLYLAVDEDGAYCGEGWLPEYVDLWTQRLLASGALRIAEDGRMVAGEAGIEPFHDPRLSTLPTAEGEAYRAALPDWVDVRKCQFCHPDTGCLLPRRYRAAICGEWVCELWEQAHPPSALRRSWTSVGQWVVALVATAVLLWFSFRTGGAVPLLSAVDLGIHEFGHLLFAWAPWLVAAFAGSFLQVAAPLALAGYFARRKDRLAVVLMLAWTAESLNNVSVYVFDATRMVLPLWGDDGTGAGHDWANILGELGLLPHTDAIAYAVRAASVLLFALAFGYAAWALSAPSVTRLLARMRERRLAARRATLPVHEPMNPNPVRPSAVEPGDREL